MTLSRRLATVIVYHPKTILLVFTIVTLLIGSQILNVYMQSDLITFLPQNDPTVQMWNKINQEFKIGSTIIIYVEADDIRDPEVLKDMDRVATKINTYKLDHGETDGIFSVTSIATLIKEENAKPWLPRGLGGTGRYQIPEDPELITSYMARIQTLEGTLFLNTFTDTVIIFQLAENTSTENILNTIKTTIEKDVHYCDMTVTGGIAVQQAMREQTFRSLAIVFGLAILFVAINMYLFHRNMKSFIIGFLPLGYSLLLTFGVLGIVHPELTILSIGAAALLIGLGDDYAVYYANRFVEEASSQDKVTRVERTLSRTGKAVAMCAIATIIGFGSLMTSSMPPMIAFGFVCLMGAAFVFISATILVPTLCIILHYEKPEKNHHWKRFSNFVVEHRKKLFTVGCFFVILSLLVLPQVKTDVNFLEMAPEGLPEVDKLLKYSEKFGQGANFNALLIETEAQGLTYPETIDAMYALEAQIRTTGASAFSIADEMKKVNDILERSAIIEKMADFVGIDKVLFDKIAQKGIVDEQYSKTIILVTFPAETGMEELQAAIESINIIVAQADIPHNGHVSPLAGQDVVTVEVNKQILSTQATSMITELLLILAVLIIGFGSTKIGILSLIPVLFVLAWEPGSLVMLDIPLSVINITVAAIIISTGIDYGIVITQRLKEERKQGYSKVEALKTTLETSGWSIVTASTTTMVAFLATFAVNIPLLHQFSIIVILLYVFAVIASFCILPTVYTSKYFK